MVTKNQLPSLKVVALSFNFTDPKKVDRTLFYPFLNFLRSQKNETKSK